MSTARDTSSTTSRYRRPIYARLLRLKHVQPGSLLCALYFEGSVFVGLLLAIAELVPWWVAVLLPIVVAVMVKLNDLIAGAVGDQPAPDLTDADDDTDGDTSDEDTYPDLIPDVDTVPDPGSSVEDGEVVLGSPEQPDTAPDSGSNRRVTSETSRQAGDVAGGEASTRPAVGNEVPPPPGAEPDTSTRPGAADDATSRPGSDADTPGTTGGPDLPGVSSTKGAGEPGAGAAPPSTTSGAGDDGEMETGDAGDQARAAETGLTAGWLRVAGGLDHTTEFSAIRLGPDGVPEPSDGSTLDVPGRAVGGVAPEGAAEVSEPGAGSVPDGDEDARKGGAAPGTADGMPGPVDAAGVRDEDAPAEDPSRRVGGVPGGEPEKSSGRSGSGSDGTVGASRVPGGEPEEWPSGGGPGGAVGASSEAGVDRSGDEETSEWLARARQPRDLAGDGPVTMSGSSGGSGGDQPAAPFVSQDSEGSTDREAEGGTTAEPPATGTSEPASHTGQPSESARRGRSTDAE